MIESFVINLDRQPERYAAFQAWNGNLGVDIRRFPAVDGALLDENARRAIATSGLVTIGGIGNAASHKRMWEYCQKQGRRIVVLEDDAVLRADFSAALRLLVSSIKGFWDIVLLGWNANGVVVVRPGERVRPPKLPTFPKEADLIGFQISVAQAPEVARLTTAFGTCGYLISPRGAARLLKECFPISDRVLLPVGSGLLVDVSGIDGMMNTIYPSMNAFVSCPPLVMTPNDEHTSTTR